MKKMIAASAVCLLAACGGGGDGGSDVANKGHNQNQLEGTWIYASDGRRTGGACGLDIHGRPGYRITLKFAGDKYSAKQEACIIFTGNQGSYLQNEQGDGTFSIGDVFVSSANPAFEMRAIDLHVSPTFYTSFNLTGTSLKLAVPSKDADGSSPEKRSYETSPTFDTASKTLIETPVYTKM